MATPLTLKALVTQDAGDVFIRTDDFAESVTYYPIVGGSKTIQAIVTEDQRRDDSAMEQRLIRVLTVECLRDSTHAKGGVANPQPGDGLERTTFDPTGPVYTLTGDIEYDGDIWLLEFAYVEVLRMGTTNTMDPIGG